MGAIAEGIAAYVQPLLDQTDGSLEQMFPLMHRRDSTAAFAKRPSPPAQSTAAAGEAYPGTGPYAPCPCNSGRKYKFCCRTKGR